MNETLKVKLLRPDSVVPEYKSDTAAGLDLQVNSFVEEAYVGQNSILLQPGKTVKVGTGIAVEIPAGYYGAIVPRSGMACNRLVTVTNSPGTIDSDYRGEIIVSLYNKGKEPQYVSYGDRIAQMIIAPYERCEIETVEELTDTKRGSGGFGSTGK